MNKVMLLEKKESVREFKPGDIIHSDATKNFFIVTQNGNVVRLDDGWHFSNLVVKSPRLVSGVIIDSNSD